NAEFDLTCFQPIKINLFINWLFWHMAVIKAISRCHKVSRLGGSNPLIQKINKINDGWKLFNTLSKVHQPTAARYCI
ncbi:TPA: hypothetical protein ACHJMZ_004524, partial [Escherichia coli]